MAVDVRAGRSGLCPILIGRERELERLEALVRGLDQGGGAATISGEAGIGKSRLVREAERLLASVHPEAVVLRGYCFQPDRGLPYGPLRDLLRGLLGEIGELSSSTPPRLHAPELVKLLPEMADLVPGLTPSPLLPPDQERSRLFRVLSEVLIDGARTGPLLLVVEDLHWCDDTSLDFLAYFARRASGLPMLALLTYRTEEATPGLWRLLAEIERGRRFTAIELGQLTPQQVEAMIAATLGGNRSLSGFMRGKVFELTDGNPFFVEEALRSLLDAGRDLNRNSPAEALADDLDIPISVQDAVRGRLADLTPATREIVSVAAAAGRRFEFPVLELVTGRSEGEVVGMMRELVAAQLVVEESADRFAFRHALTREAIYGRLLLRERRSLHRAIGMAIATLDAERLETRLGDLAYHMHEAQEWRQALEYSLRLGRLAEMHNDPQAAVLHFSRGLHAAQELGVPAPHALLLGRGDAYAELGSFDLALADHRAALHGATVDGDWRAQARAHLSLGMLWSGRDYETCGHHYRQADQLAREHDDVRLRSACLNRLGNWHLNLEQPEQALAFHQEALLLFRELGDEAGIAETLDLLSMASCLSGDLIAGSATYRQAVEIFRRHDNRQGLSSSLATLSLRGATLQTNTMAVTDDPLSACIADAEAALELARDIGWLAGEAYALCMLAFSLGSRGDYAAALGAAEASLALAREIDHLQWMAAASCALGAIHLEMQDTERAAESLTEARELARTVSSRHWLGVSAGLLASSCIQAGELEQALRVLAPQMDPPPPKQTLAQRMLWCARAEAELARGSPGEALKIVDGIIATSPHAASRPIARVGLLRGRALRELGDREQARDALTAALDVANAQGAAGLVWRLRLALAECDLVAGRRTSAQIEISAALTVVEQLACSFEAQEEREIFLRSVNALVPRIRPLTRLQAQKAAYSGLTARQRQVARLIALGHSNHAIAQSLNLSDRTVESHVTAILTTLDFASRTQIAAWAVARGLIDLDEAT